MTINMNDNIEIQIFTKVKETNRGAQLFLRSEY